MSHKTNPKALRIRGIQNWSSQGFYGRRFPQKLQEDFFIRKFILEKCREAGIESVIIERFPAKFNIIVKTARPGLIIGRGGSGAEELKKELRQRLIILEKKKKIRTLPSARTLISRKGSELGKISGAGAKIPEIRIEIQEVRNPWICAELCGQALAKQIEKRIPFRRALKQTLENIMENKEIKGARIQISGRLDGVEISRREWLKKGRLPRQTLRSDIDYAESTAHCVYGAIGIKVWLYKGEKFE